MKMFTSLGRGDRAALAAATGGLLATSITAVACVGPLVAILLGIGGFGWLTQYAHLRVPASLATLAVLALGFWWVYPRPSSCAQNRCRSKLSRVVLWSATVLAVAVNVFEYIVFPRLL